MGSPNMLGNPSVGVSTVPPQNTPNLWARSCSTANVNISSAPQTLDGITQTSGSLIIGKTYIITTYVSSDDFTNVGAASNATNVVFTATGTTPTDYTNGSTLTVALIATDRVLLKNQTDPTENGVYVFNGVGVAMTRATDFNSTTEFAFGALVNITEGATCADTVWSLTSDNPVIPTDNIVFAEINSNDQDAIHDNVAGEIVAVTEKTTSVANDEVLIEDSANSNNKKSMKLSAMAAGVHGSGTDDRLTQWNGTTGQLEDSSLANSSGTISNLTGSFFTKGSGATGFGIDSSNFIRFDTNAFGTYFGGTLMSQTASGGTSFPQDVSITGTARVIFNSTTAFMKWQRESGATVEEKLDLVLKGSNRVQQIQPVAGTKAVYGTFDSTTALTTDNTTVTTVFTVNTSYKWTTTTTGTDWNPGSVVFTPPLLSGAQPAVGEVYHCTTGGTVTDNDDSDAVPVLNVTGNYLLITSDSSTAANRTIAISTTYGSGATVATGHEMTIEFNTSSSEKAEITGVLSAAGGALTFNAGAVATIKQLLYTQFNGTAWVSVDGIKTVIA